MLRSVARFPSTVQWIDRRSFQTGTRLLAKDGEEAPSHPPLLPGLAAKTRHERLAKEHGYFHEMLELKKTKGKPYLAAKGLVAAADSSVFPLVEGETLTNSQLSLPAAARGKVTLVALSFKQVRATQYLTEL